MSQPYLDLVSMADEELALAVAGRWDDLPAAIERRARRAAALPVDPPPAARPLLRRLAVLQAQLEDLLSAGRAETGRELAKLASSRGAVRGYHATSAQRGERVDGAA